MTWAKLFVFLTIGAVLIYYRPLPSDGLWPFVILVACIVSLVVLLLEMGSAADLFRHR